MISAAQSKAARALLDWSQTDLARECALGESTIRDFEKGRRTPTIETMDKIQDVFEKRDVIFIANGAKSDSGGEGVRFLREETKDYDDVRLVVLAETLNELRSAIVMFEQKLRDDIRDDGDLRTLILNNVRYGFKDVYRRTKAEYEEAYHRIHGTSPPQSEDDHFPF